MGIMMVAQEARGLYLNWMGIVHRGEAVYHAVVTTSDQLVG